MNVIPSERDDSKERGAKLLMRYLAIRLKGRIYHCNANLAWAVRGIRRWLPAIGRRCWVSHEIITSWDETDNLSQAVSDRVCRPNRPRTKVSAILVVQVHEDTSQHRQSNSSEPYVFYPLQM